MLRLVAVVVLLTAFPQCAIATTPAGVRHQGLPAPPGQDNTPSDEPDNDVSRRLLRSRPQLEAAEYCVSGNDFAALYDGVAADLKHWHKTGITPRLMDWVLTSIFRWPVRFKGAGILFQNGTPYIITDTALLNNVSHHKRLITAHFALFLALSTTFGTSIPDVEFLFSSSDEPSSLLAHHHSGYNPERLPLVLGFCKSASYADVLIPDIHFFLRNFTGTLLASTANFTARWPWESKTPKLFGRFAPYPRIVSRHAPELYRQGKRGKNICVKASNDSWFCHVRKHYVWEWARGANRSGLPVDVAQQPRRDMMHHASHKWLLHLDGQTCSSRLEQLLALGSLVVKEESGYRAFFHHLLQPYTHYVPVWKKFPEETKSVLEWAQENDAQAASIAAEAQKFALRYLHKRALLCYWYKLLTELGRFMRYRPGPAGGARKYKHLTPLKDYMEAEGWAELAEHDYSNMEFWD